MVMPPTRRPPAPTSPPKDDNIGLKLALAVTGLIAAGSVGYFIASNDTVTDYEPEQTYAGDMNSVDENMADANMATDAGIITANVIDSGAVEEPTVSDAEFLVGDWNVSCGGNDGGIEFGKPRSDGYAEYGSFAESGNWTLNGNTVEITIEEEMDEDGDFVPRKPLGSYEWKFKRLDAKRMALTYDNGETETMIRCR